MTAILAIESNKLNEKVIIGDEIDNAYGSNLYLKKKEELTIEDLVYGLMLRSGNDASYSIAKNVYQNIPNFIKQMNLKAKQLKMNNTTFNNPNGLDEEKGNYSTAYDMALLTSYAMKNKTYKKIVKTKKYEVKTNMNTYIWKNKNKLLNTNYITGGKTGYTKKAKRTLVSTSSKNKLNLVVVTLNDGNDWLDHKKLHEYIFNNYKSYQILKKGNIKVIDEYNSKYKYYIKNSFSYPLTKKEKNNITLKFIINKKSKNGYVEVYLYEKLIHKENLYRR